MEAVELGNYLAQPGGENPPPSNPLATTAETSHQSAEAQLPENFQHDTGDLDAMVSESRGCVVPAQWYMLGWPGRHLPQYGRGDVAAAPGVRSDAGSWGVVVACGQRGPSIGLVRDDQIVPADRPRDGRDT